MSDTVLFGKVVSKTTKAMLLYATTTVALAVGQAFFSLKRVEWDSWWMLQKIGWFLLLVGNVSNTIKAFYSNSSKSI